MNTTGTPLAKKMPNRLKEKLERRQLNISARSPAASRQSRVTGRRDHLIALRQLRSATHNQRVITSKVKSEMRRELQSYRTAINSEARQEQAEARRQQQIDDTVARVAAQNEASKEHAANVERLEEAKAENLMLKQMHSQAVADKRRREYNFLRTHGAALHNERVALTKDYMRISDYFEEVTDDDEEVLEDEDDVEKEDSDGGSYDQWSNAVNVGDEESYAESSYHTGYSTGAQSAGAQWDLGRNMLMNAYTYRFRREATQALLVGPRA